MSKQIDKITYDQIMIICFVQYLRDWVQGIKDRF